MNNKKIKSILTIVLFSATLLFFTVGDFLNKDRLFSETENRVLAGSPDISVKNILNGTFSKEYEEYITDQFTMRDSWISVKTHTDISLGKKSVNNIYLAKDDFLIEKHLPDMFGSETITKKTDMLINFLKEFPETKIMLAPTADNILTDKLPAHAIYFDQRKYVNYVTDRLTENNNKTDDISATSPVINIFDILSAHNKEAIYYKTDHHWTSLGAYYAYLAWAKSLNITPVNYNTNNMKSVTSDFKGTLHSKINIPVKPDNISIFKETLNFDGTLIYDNTITTNSLYETKHLNTKNKYGYFLDDNHGIVEIEGKYRDIDSLSDKTLFVIKDSYANTFIPLLVPHYKKIYVIDLRYFREDVTEFIQQHSQDISSKDDKKIEKTDTLILYNCIHFLEDFELNPNY